MFQCCLISLFGQPATACTGSGDLAISFNSNDVVSSSCSNICDASAKITVSGGSGDYYYFWSTGDQGADVDELDALCGGVTYTVVVVDLGAVAEGLDFDPNLPQIVRDPAGVLNQFDWCYYQKAEVTPGGGDVDCATLESECIGNEPGNCECPLIVSVASNPGTCAENVDGEINLSISGGSGFYNVTWSHNSNARSPKVQGGRTYKAIIEDSDGRRMDVEVPVGVRPGRDCVVSGTVSVSTRPIYGELDVISVFINSIRNVLEATLGIKLPPTDADVQFQTSFLDCDFIFQADYQSPEKIADDNGRYQINVFSQSNNNPYSFVIDGSSNATGSNNDVVTGVHTVYANLEPSSIEQKQACDIVFTFSLYPTCVPRVDPQCEVFFTVEESEKPGGCKGEVCNGVLKLTFNGYDNGSGNIEEPSYYSVSSNGQMPEIVTGETQFFVDGVCLGEPYFFEVSAGGCVNSKVKGIVLNEEKSTEFCCPAKLVSIDEDKLYCSGDVLYAYASGGDNYLWNGEGILESDKRKSTVKIVVPDYSTFYSVIIGNNDCNEVSEREKEVTFLLKVHDVPDIKITPSVSSPYCFLNNDQLILESEYLDKPDYMEYKTSWDYLTTSPIYTSSDAIIAPYQSNVATLFFDKINSSSEVDRSLRVSPRINYANCEDQPNDCDLVCELLMPEVKYTLLSSSLDIEVPDVIDVCGFALTATSIDLNSYISGDFSSVCWSSSMNNPGDCMSFLSSANYSVSSNQTVNVSIVTTDGCEFSENVMINYVELDEVEYQVTSTNCEEGYLRVTLPFENEYQWEPNQGLSCSDCRSPRVYLDAAADVYTVNISAKNLTCEGSIEVDISTYLNTLNKSLDDLRYDVEKLDQTACNYKFISNISDADKYVWNFGDGVIVESFNPEIIHGFNNPGAYSVELHCFKDCSENTVSEIIEVEISNCSCHN